MKKIRTLDSIEVLLDGGNSSIEAKECLDGGWNIEIREHNNKLVRLGIPVSGGTYFIAMEDIYKLARREYDNE